MAVKPTKLETISKQLHRPAGVNIAQLRKVTGWQSHSIRAALTGLRKKGHAIERSKSAKGETVYRIIEGTWRSLPSRRASVGPTSPGSCGSASSRRRS